MYSYSSAAQFKYFPNLYPEVKLWAAIEHELPEKSFGRNGITWASVRME